MAIISWTGGYRYQVELEDNEYKQLQNLYKNSDFSRVETLRRVIERGLIELTGELPENRS